MNIIGIIPARYASTRFPGKPLHLIAGKPLLQHVVERCRGATSLSEVIVATDDERIAEVAREFCSVEMTRADHPSGTDRIAEATKQERGVVRKPPEVTCRVPRGIPIPILDTAAQCNTEINRARSYLEKCLAKV